MQSPAGSSVPSTGSRTCGVDGKETIPRWGGVGPLRRKNDVWACLDVCGVDPVKNGSHGFYMSELVVL